MEMKDFAKYLKYESFDKALHHIRQISSERTTEAELSVKIYFRCARIQNSRRNNQ
jgi:hypothetical protein